MVEKRASRIQNIGDTMTLQLNELVTIYPEHLWIELPSEVQGKIWQIVTQEAYSNHAARWRGFLNHLCLHTLFNWLPIEPETPIICPNRAELSSFWEIVNGTVLTVGKTRLALIPSDKSSQAEFHIPQEWVDIPNWAVNYYLAVQLNLEAGWLRVWGYATHQQIREEGKYDPIDRNYCLEPEDLIADINMMWIARELFAPQKLEIKSLPKLSTAQVEKLLAQLSQHTPFSPRLCVPFGQWAALITADKNRQSLYQKRLQSRSCAVKCQPQINNLSHWWQNFFTGGWQPLDSLLHPQHLAFQFRHETDANTIRVQGAKLIDLGMQLEGVKVVLLVALTLESDRKVSIRVQLHPASGQTYLPANLKLILLSQAGTMLQEVQSRNLDRLIQLKRFKSPLGKSFGIEVALGNVNIREDFVLESPIGA